MIYYASSLPQLSINTILSLVFLQICSNFNLAEKKLIPSRLGDVPKLCTNQVQILLIIVGVKKMFIEKN
jgi:hypothetical protein